MCVCFYRNANFPALGDSRANNKKQPSGQLTHGNKQKKEEEAVQKLFQDTEPKDPFDQWCEKALAGKAGSVHGK